MTVGQIETCQMTVVLVLQMTAVSVLWILMSEACPYVFIFMANLRLRSGRMMAADRREAPKAVAAATHAHVPGSQSSFEPAPWKGADSD